MPAAQASLKQLRKICLALPETTEQVSWERTPTFRVRNKIFAMFVDDGRETEGVSVWCKAAPGGQEVLVGADPQRFFAPPYVGPKGWIGIRLDGRVEWGAVATLVEDSYRLIAPTRLATALEGQ